jgi:hypothetical protein
MCSTLVVAMLELNNTFFLECDASNKGIGEILIQEGCPLDFSSDKLCDRNLGKSTYGNEILSIIHAIDMWHSYLMACNFHIKTHHCNLKCFLEQTLPP